MTPLHKLKRKDVKVCSPNDGLHLSSSKHKKIEQAKAAKMEGGDSPLPPCDSTLLSKARRNPEMRREQRAGRERTCCSLAALHKAL